jgi:hypothetical protein
MKARILILTVALAGAAFAQRYGGGLVGGLASQPYGSVSGFGSVLFPGTGHAPLPSFGGSYSRGGHYGGGYYGGSNYGYGHRRYPPVAMYPVFVGGYGYGYGLMDDPPPVQQQQPPQTIVVQQPAPAQSAPTPSVVINQYFKSDGPAGPPEPQAFSGQPGPAAAAVARSDDKPTIYLIAMKDHTIMPALGYWVEGDMLTYITSQGNKNSVSLTLVDKDFSKQLNDERHIEFNL